jgi:hypothetical protein
VRVLITGGRGFADREMLYTVLDRLNAIHTFTVLIHGAAPGADTLGGEWAKERGIEDVLRIHNDLQFVPDRPDARPIPMPTRVRIATKVEVALATERNEFLAEQYGS